MAKSSAAPAQLCQYPDAGELSGKCNLPADNPVHLRHPFSPDAQLLAVRRQHDCGCEICSSISVVCPASASSYAMEIIRLRAAHQALYEALSAARDRMIRSGWAVSVSPSLRKVYEQICAALALVDAAKEQK